MFRFVFKFGFLDYNSEILAHLSTIYIIPSIVIFTEAMSKDVFSVVTISCLNS